MLLVDLLTAGEQQRRRSPERDLPLIARRLDEVTRWALAESEIPAPPIGYLGASTGAAAALRAAVAVGDAVGSVVSLGGRPELASDDLAEVAAPTLLLAGSRDPEALGWAREAAKLMRGPHELTVVDGAGRLFAEPGTLETAARLSAEWCTDHLAANVAPLGAGVRRTTAAANFG